MDISDKTIDLQRVPRHIAIIMDGNGRWAKQRGLPRSAGHQQGVETVRVITEEAVRLGVEYLTLYTFSTENWSRPEAEVGVLMNLLLNSLEEEIFMKNNVRMRCIGDLSRLPQAVRQHVETVMEHTKNNTAMTVVLAISYSARWELTEGVRNIACAVKEGRLQPDEITESVIAHRLASEFIPDPELLIRTGGEQRLSNFLLWQCAYTELYFCETFWPDFDAVHLQQAITEYQKRERRFGKTSEQLNPTKTC